MAVAVYALCALTSLVATILLARGYSRSRARLLLWSAICFGWLTVNNVVLFVDKVVAPDTDLSLARGLTALVGVAALLYGLVWESR